MLVNSLVLLLISLFQGVAVFYSLTKGDYDKSIITGFVITAVIAYIGFKYIYRSVLAIKGTLEVFAKNSAFKQVMFFFGYILLVLSALIHLVTFSFMGYFALTRTSGIPSGMVTGLAILMFILSVILLGSSMKMHNNRLQSDAAAPGS